MAKTIEQLADQANIIQTAVRQGENTAERVGGLFTDIVDYLSNYKASEVKLGPLLTSLNDPRLVNPGDGQTLSFSIMKDGWTFDDALTELRISDRRIEETVTSNYRLFLETKDEFEEDMRDITDDLNAKYADFSSYRIQTDQYIDQWCVAYDEYGNKVAVSRIYQTSEEIQSMVTDNKEAADIAFTKLFTLTGLNYDDPSQAYSASWLWQKKDGIYGAAASFDANGNILQSSQLQVTVGGIQTQVTNNKNAADAALTKVYNVVGLDYSNPSQSYTASWISQNKDSVLIAAGAFDSDGNLQNTAGLVTTDSYAGLFVDAMDANGVVTSGNISTYLTSYVTAKGVEEIISVAKISADQITFDFTHQAQFYAVNGDQRTEVMNINPNGDLWILGDLLGGNIKGNYTIGSTGNKMEIYCDETIVGDQKASGIRGLNAEGRAVLNLGFNEMNGSTSPYLSLKGKQAFTQHEVQILIRPDTIAFLPIVGNKPPITFGYALGSNKLYLSTWLEAWPTRDEVGVGQVFLGDDEILRVRRG